MVGGVQEIRQFMQGIPNVREEKLPEQQAFKRYAVHLKSPTETHDASVHSLDYVLFPQ